MNAIEYKGKEKKVDEVLATGVIRCGKYFYIQCEETEEWCFSHQDRMNKLIEKWGSYDNLFGNVLSNGGKKLRKDSGKPSVPAQKKVKPTPKPEEKQSDSTRVKMSSKGKKKTYEEWLELHIYPKIRK